MPAPMADRYAGTRAGANSICGVFSAESDMACDGATVRQEAIDYLEREVPIHLPGRQIVLAGGSPCRGQPRKHDDVVFNGLAETSEGL